MTTIVAGMLFKYIHSDCRSEEVYCVLSSPVRSSIPSVLYAIVMWGNGDINLIPIDFVGDEDDIEL